MPEYIEREALLDDIDAAMQNTGMGVIVGQTLKRYVKRQPASDVVEVVRCKDCAIPHNRFTGCPKLNGLIPPENHFCSFGERKEGDTE